MTLHTASPLTPLQCPRSCCWRPGRGGGPAALGWAFWRPGPWGAWVHCRGAALSLPYTLETWFRKKAGRSGRAVAGVRARGPRGSGAAVASVQAGLEPPLLVSAAARWHEAVHEGLARPRPRWQLRLSGHGWRAASRGQPGPPPVQPHRLEEEKTCAHQGQPARQPQQVMLRRPLARLADGRGGHGARPGDQAWPATLHAPCVATSSRAAPCVVCEALDVDAICCLPGAACRAGAGLHGTRGLAGVGPPLGTVLPCGLGTLISRCRSSGVRTPVFVGRSSLFYCPHILF